jgi:hypothetical protein
MASERQHAANRANSRRSTGPKTLEGKAVVRFNGLRHGLLARAAVVLPGEDASAFEDLRDAIRADLAPIGPVESFLTDRVVNAMWRLWRLERVETALFHWRAHKIRADHLASQLPILSNSLFDMLDLSDRSPNTTKKALDRSMQECRRDEVLLARAFDADTRDGDAFGNLSRYQAGLERTLSRSLYELRQLQDQRRNRSSTVLDAEADQTEVPAI